MWAGVVTLFPELFTTLESGITGRAIRDKLLEINTFNPRDFTHDKHHTVDDKPYGGGPGMLMKAPPLVAAISAAKEQSQNAPVIYLSPRGKKFNQEAAARFADLPALILVAGRYEGIDERVIDQYVDEEWSIGDYILSGGELPAMVMLDAITRLLPGALGDEQSADMDTLSDGLLKHPQYTRPLEFAGQTVPDMLLSGNHQRIAEFRLKASLGETWLKRPDLLIKRGLSDDELSLLQAYLKEYLLKT